MRGPLVYCLESTDLPKDVGMQSIALPRTVKLIPRFDRGLLDGVTVLEGKANASTNQAWGTNLYREFKPAAPRPVDVKLIPYYAWANRGKSEMTVWLPLGADATGRTGTGKPREANAAISPERRTRRKATSPTGWRIGDARDPARRYLESGVPGVLRGRSAIWGGGGAGLPAAGGVARCRGMGVRKRSLSGPPGPPGRAG